MALVSGPEFDYEDRCSGVAVFGGGRLVTFVYVIWAILVSYDTVLCVFSLQ